MVEFVPLRATLNSLAAVLDPLAARLNPLVAALNLPYPFEREYMQLALVAALVVGASAPLVGAFLVQKRLSLMGDGIGHVAFAGVAAGLLTGLAPLWTALAAAVAAALTIEWLRSRGRAGGDLALALFFYVGIAGGVVLIGLGGSLNGGILTYLFGSILTVTRSDAVLITVIGAVAVAVVARCWRAFFAIVLDPEAARVAGVPVDRLNLALSVLTAVIVVAGMRVVGVLLVAALMVLPVGAGQRLAGSFRSMLIRSSAVGMASAVAGLTAARQFALAPGATIVLMAAGFFIVAAVLGKPAASAGQSAATPLGTGQARP
ncbi:MAG: metal ABC transporter permease [Acidimicrobiales bacterium]